jgi:hypothetical protein
MQPKPRQTALKPNGPAMSDSTVRSALRRMGHGNDDMSAMPASSPATAA